MALGRSGIELPVVLALLAGGVVAAPIAAWLVRKMHPRLLGTSVGAIIILTNMRTLLTTVGVRPAFTFTAYGVAFLAIVAAVGVGISRVIKERTAQPLPAAAR
jgi:hypothetical protein